MHILYLHQYFCPPGGSGNNRSYELAKAWVQQGHRVTLVTSQAYFPPALLPDFSRGPAYLSFDGIKVIVVNVPYSHMMPFRKRVGAFLRFYSHAGKVARKLTGFDLIYASSTPNTVGELGRKLARKWNTPFVFETVDVWPDVPIGMGILKNRLLIQMLHRRTNRIYEEAAAVVTLSEGMREQVLSHGVDPAKVSVVHNGTHPEQIPFILRQEKMPVTIIYSGTVGMANGLDQLLSAAKWLQEKGHIHLHFMILGAGNDLVRVKQLAENWQLKQVEFRNRVAKEVVPEIMAQADIGAVCFAPFPVLEANSANKFYDYLASGLPVVTNYEGWQAHYLKTHECGLSSPQGDPITYAKKFLRLADDFELRQRMAIKGRKLVEDKFDRRKLADQLLQLFQQVLKED